MAEATQTNVNFNGYIPSLYRTVRPTDSLGADELVPAGAVSEQQYKEDASNSKVSIKPASIPTQTIDVHRYFSWTLSPEAARAYTPVVELTEYRQVLSSELMGYAYQAAGAIDNVRVAARLLPTAVTAGAAALGTNIKRANIPGTGVATNAANVATRVAKSAGSFINAVTFGAAGAVAEGLTQGANNLASGAADMLGMPTNEVANQDFTKNDPFNSALRPYTGLYAVEPTGFVYRLPYLEQSLVQQANSWGNFTESIAAAIQSASENEEKTETQGKDSSKTEEALSKSGMGGSVLGKALKGLGKTVVAAQGLTTVTGGAISTETPQAYKGPTERDKLTVKFTLYNTVEFTDIKRNWELCYLLTYQNLPNRKGINLMDPPKLYRLIIPGYKQFPMCWVTDLKIKNVGAVRMMDIRNGNRVITAIDERGPYIKMIPEAYEIEITFQHAFYASQNLFAYAESPSNTVTTALNVPQYTRVTRNADALADQLTPQEKERLLNTRYQTFPPAG